MRFGLIVPQGWREDLDGRDFETMVGVARRAEKLGFDSIWLYDHLQTRDGDPDRVLECWTSLAALSRETTRVRLGQIVTCALYRNPGLLAQMASTVDAASGGRVLVGLGAGWDEREWREFGYGEWPDDPRAASPPRADAPGAACATRRQTDPGRRRRREGAAAPGRAVCRCVQLHRLVRSGVLSPQARRPPQSLRGGRTRLRRDREDRVVHGARGRGSRLRALARAGHRDGSSSTSIRSRIWNGCQRPSASETRQMSSGLTGTRVSSRPVAARSAATIAAVETTVGGSPTPFTP